MEDLDALLADLQTATSHLQQPKQGGVPEPAPVPTSVTPTHVAGHYQPPPPHQHQHQVKTSTVTTHYHPPDSPLSPPPTSTTSSQYPLVHNGDFASSQAYRSPQQQQPSYQYQQQQQQGPIYEATYPTSPAPQPSHSPTVHTNYSFENRGGIPQQPASNYSTPQKPPAPPQTNYQATPPQTNYQATPPPPPQTNYQATPPPPPQTNYQATPPQANYQAAPSMTSTLNSNLSELDSLLEDLQAAQFAAQVPPSPTPPAGQVTYTTTTTVTTKKMPPAVAPKPKKPEGSNGPAGREVVDHGPSQYSMSSPQQHTVSQPQHATTVHAQMQSPTPRSASTATKELDDLMASLSDFKMTSQGGQQPVTSDVPYSQPQKQPRPQAAPAASVATSTPAPAAPRGSQLDSMLGHLQTDMHRHGVQTVPKGHCAACNKPIVGQLVTALGKTWHPEHFTCAHCQVELGTQNFFERDGQPFCDKDYHNLFSPRCAYCHGPILEKCVTALDKTWHPEHFFCAQCGRHFADEGFHEKDGKAFCREDYFDMFAPKCAGCNHAIVENYISALNVQWHPDCFVCTECRTPFNGGSFFDHEGRPYCEIHYHAIRGSLCCGCNKPITGRCITAMHKKFHPEHFVCAFCLKQLNKGTFKEQNDKPYCHPCFVKLFG
ncbi:paxillin-like [Glandiceps talaboti]